MILLNKKKFVKIYLYNFTSAYNSIFSLYVLETCENNFFKNRSRLCYK